MANCKICKADLDGYNNKICIFCEVNWKFGK